MKKHSNKELLWEAKDDFLFLSFCLPQEELRASSRDGKEVMATITTERKPDR